MACVEGFERHKWGEDGVCSRGCGSIKGDGVASLNASEDSTLAGMEARLEQPQTVESKWKQRAAKKRVEDEARKLLCSANARSFIHLLESGKALAFAGLGLAYPGITLEEQAELTMQLTRILDVLEYDISNPYVMCILFVLSYVQICYRQYIQAQAVSEEKEDVAVQ